MWAPQVSFLLENGYRVVAPDLRGCGLSERPIGVEHYAFESLIADVLGIADALEIATFTIVAHDWGGILAWILAALVPDRVVSAAILGAPHPSELFPIRSVEQARQSFYMLLFQHPGVGEQWLRAHDWRMFRELFEGSEVEALIADLTPPGKLEARLDWYRAGASAESFFLETSDEDVPPVIVPVLLLSGTRDQFLTEPPFQRSGKRCTGYFRHERIDAGHWIAHDQPERVHALLLDFLHDRDPVAPATP
jgi:pimeloyl-ACP methyl ester carboxylesterase